MNHTSTLAIGQYVSLKSMEGKEWNIFLIHRQDVQGNFYAKHMQEFSCYEVQVTAESILKVESLHHNIPHLKMLNDQYLEGTRIVMTGAVAESTMQEQQA